MFEHVFQWVWPNNLIVSVSDKIGQLRSHSGADDVEPCLGVDLHGKRASGTEARPRCNPSPSEFHIEILSLGESFLTLTHPRSVPLAFFTEFFDLGYDTSPYLDSICRSYGVLCHGFDPHRD
ncbi:hypothetical protein BHM03_00012410 [Ensete ventricosum]|nr:hypothetical protein BHM03_00012410 [Ensete ventricosum]